MSSDNTDDNVRILKRIPRITAPGYDVALTQKQAQEIADVVNMPGFKILKNIFVAQRKDHIARMALNSAKTIEQLHYYNGMASELTLHYNAVEKVKKIVQAEDLDDE